MALTLSLPDKLETLGEILEISKIYRKNKGMQFITRFGKPRKSTKNDPRTRIHPQDEINGFDEYLAYNKQDVVAERAIYNKLREIK